MKIKLNTNRVINGITLSFVAFWALMITVQINHLPIRLFNWGKDDEYNGWTNDLKPIDEQISYDKPHSEYIKLTDSIKTTRILKNGEFTHGSGVQAGPIGTTGALQCDTCSIKWIIFDEFKNADAHMRYYIKLTDWKLKLTRNELYYNDSVSFYVERNQGYIRKVVTANGTKKAHLADIPVKFRYNRQDNSLLIPVTKNTKNVLEIVLTITGMLLALYIVFLMLNFTKFIVDLSKGFSFTDDNILRLKIIAISLLAYPAIMFLINYALRLIFHEYFTPDVVLSTSNWYSSWQGIAAGIVFLLLYRAFRQGKLLKEEQDLTV